MLTIGVLMSAGPEGARLALAGMDVELVVIPLPKDLAPVMERLDVLLVSNDYYTQEVAALCHASKRLRWIQGSSTGNESILTIGAPRHIPVTSAGPIYSAVVAEHGVAMLLAFARGLLPIERQRARGEWNREAVTPRMFSLDGLRLVAVGFGGIGQHTARLVRPFGTRVTAVVRRPPPAEVAALADEVVMLADLHAALARADAVVLGVPYGPATHFLMGAAEFAAMKRGGVLINIARGNVVDQQAMIAALRGGQLGAAGLDVFDTEPLAADSPLWGMENVIISPHLSGYGNARGWTDFVAMFRGNVERFLAGKPLDNPIEGYIDRAA